MKLKVKNFNWYAGHPVVILNEKTAKKMNIFVDDRVEITTPKKRVYAPVDIFTKLIKNNEIGISHELGRIIKTKTGTKIEVSSSELSEASFLIKKKLNGATLTQKELTLLISEIVHNNLSEGEIAFFTAAEKLQGMSSRETINLTKAMVKTGARLKFKGKYVADKHCIGGVAGNRTTPIIVAICASLGITIPKTSSRAITSASGTADVIETISDVELPLKKPELFKSIGITPPKGILLHGPPGTGKTILAKAVAASTNSTFIEIVASELVQKFIGEGARLVKEVFNLAREKAPSIVFIDEIDALAAKRIEIGTSGEREVQRTFMQFLAELDGFKPLDNVKIIGATNRKDILDPAIIRPGRLDRLIHIDNPNKEGIEEIFKIHTKNMKLERIISTKDIIKAMDGFSGAEIRAVCTEAGYFAIRENRKKVVKEDFLKGIEKVKREEEIEGKNYLKMFG